MTLDNIISPEKLFEMAKEAHSIAKIQMTGDDPTAYVDRANEIVSWMSTTGHMLACARYHRDKAVQNCILQNMRDSIDLPASTLNMLIKSTSADLNYLVNFIEEIDKGIKYQCEMLRSLISYSKQELSNQMINQ